MFHQKPAHARGAFVLGSLLLLAAPVMVFAQDNNSPPPPPSSTQPAQPPPTGAQRPATGGFVPEPGFLTNALDYITQKWGDDVGSDRGGKNGFYPEFSNMITGSGWVSAGPGYRRYFSDDRIMIDGSAAASWHAYAMMQGKFELPKLANDHLVVGAQVMWQDDTQVNYFGIGPDSVQDDRSLYQLRTTDIVSYATVKPNDWLSIGGEFGWLTRPKVMGPGGTFIPSLPTTQEEFPDDPGVSLSYQPHFAHGEAALLADTRDHRGYPSRGGLYRAALTSYFDQSAGTFSFRQYEAEAVKFIPLSESRWVLAFRGWTLYSAIPSGHEIPFYLLPAIGGNNTLRDFNDYRFHDNNLLNVNAESRWALYEHVDAAAFFDAGNVAARFGDLNLAKTSYGAGLRLHNDTTTFARADLAYGPEGWRFVFRTSDPFRLPRVRRHIAIIPFAP